MNKNLIRRESYLKQIQEFKNSDFVKVITGIRRSGKTSLLYLIVEELKNENVPEKNIIFISFESPEYNSIEYFKELDKIIYEKTKNLEGKIYLFFDEIQKINMWEKSINGYRVTLNCDIYISGSNSKLLSSELATTLAGRYVKIKVYPFSFSEILQYKKEIEGLNFSSKESIKTLFNEEYVNYGGMPSILTLKGDEVKKSALRDIFDSILLNDIIERFQIKRIDLLKRFTRYMMHSIGQTFSSKSIKNYLKGNNINTTQDTLLKYNDYLQQTYFLSKCKRYDLKGKKEMKIEEKYYLMDHGFHHALIDNNNAWIPRILENIVYIELLRRNYNVTVGRTDNKKEIDFICKKNGQYKYIQVSYVLSDEKTIKREYAPFFRIKDKFDAYIITTDEFDLSRDGIKHLNVIDFLLGDDI